MEYKCQKKLSIDLFEKYLVTLCTAVSGNAENDKKKMLLGRTLLDKYHTCSWTFFCTFFQSCHLARIKDFLQKKNIFDSQLDFRRCLRFTAFCQNFG